MIDGGPDKWPTRIPDRASRETRKPNRKEGKKGERETKVKRGASTYQQGTKGLRRKDGEKLEEGRKKKKEGKEVRIRGENERPAVEEDGHHKVLPVPAPAPTK